MNIENLFAQINAIEAAFLTMFRTVDMPDDAEDIQKWDSDVQTAKGYSFKLTKALQNFCLALRDRKKPPQQNQSNKNDDWDHDSRDNPKHSQSSSICLSICVCIDL